jgi:hypothetical protein
LILKASIQEMECFVIANTYFFVSRIAETWTGKVLIPITIEYSINHEEDE